VRTENIDGLCEYGDEISVAPTSHTYIQYWKQRGAVPSDYLLCRQDNHNEACWRKRKGDLMKKLSLSQKYVIQYFRALNNKDKIP